MDNIKLLAVAMEYIENHLDKEIKTEDVASACYCSKSTLEKLFKCINNITIREYLVRRRMMKAARVLWENADKSILEVALQYGYNSNEAFTRAFKQIWNCKPSEFRKKRQYSELFPRLEEPLENGDAYMRERKHVDISELYDLFITRKDCYFVCCDIKNLIPINEISRKAGDLAILETLKRMQDAAGAEDVVFRIGGDEFVLLTDSSEVKYAEKIAEEIASHNGETYLYENEENPLNLYVGITKFQHSHLTYNEFFTELHAVIKNTK